MKSEKQRHGCLTVWIILMIGCNALVVAIYLTAAAGMGQFPEVPVWALLLLSALGFLKVTSLLALWKWRKWGFWGICVLSMAAMLINVAMGVRHLLSSTAAVAGILILFGLLLMGKEHKGWTLLD